MSRSRIRVIVGAIPSQGSRAIIRIDLSVKLSTSVTIGPVGNLMVILYGIASFYPHRKPAIKRLVARVNSIEELSYRTAFTTTPFR